MAGVQLIGGMRNVSTTSTEKGTAPKRIHGRNLPQRLRVRSAIMPKIGSLTESQIRVTRNMVPTAAGASPKTSV